MGKILYLVWFVPADAADAENELLIGVYESENDAKAAIDRLRDKKGFVDYPQGFEIHLREIGQDSWTEGFVRD